MVSASHAYIDYLLVIVQLALGQHCHIIFSILCQYPTVIKTAGVVFYHFRIPTKSLWNHKLNGNHCTSHSTCMFLMAFFIIILIALSYCRIYQTPAADNSRQQEYCVYQYLHWCCIMCIDFINSGHWLKWETVPFIRADR